VRLLEFFDYNSTNSNIRSTYGFTVATALSGLSGDDKLLMIAPI